MDSAAVDTPVLALPRAAPAGTPLQVSIYLMIILKKLFTLYDA